MSRPPRAAEGGLVDHALNRASARLTIFDGYGDFAADLANLPKTVPDPFVFP